MANLFSPMAFFSFLLASLTFSFALGTHKKVYIVYMGAKPENELLAVEQHTSVLQEVLQTSLVQDSLVYSYKRSFNGFAANLTEEESRKIAGMKGVISVFPNRMYKLQTTRSWDFLGFPSTVNRVNSVESDIIVGLFDTGIWPESKSFDDQGLGPPPKKWKGVCDRRNFKCNNKIIGARVYPETYSFTARDEIGHGSHTASTIAGRSVQGVSFYGLAEGNARGGVPSAKIALYKVCSLMGCSSRDVLAAFDDAIADGVDIISVSFGLPSTEFFEDPIAIGSFHAMAKGILSSHAAGNDGPSLGSLSSAVPWILSVAATSIDRKFISKFALGNGETLVGNTINSFSLNGTMFPLVTGADVTNLNNCERYQARWCSFSCLDRKLSRGKIVLCEGDNPMEAFEAGALGLVIERRSEDVDDVSPFPTSSLSHDQLNRVFSYVNNTSNALANIFKSESVLDMKAPTVASFSSRGPNKIVPQILKPDISAPGVEILAGWSPLAFLSESAEDRRRAKYHIVSGTSMACPHATAAAAYVKSFHPDWSPSAIKSALMTTATRISRERNSEGEFAYGSGNINPVNATNPGLVFDSTKEDYIQLLCYIGYTTKQVRSISGDTANSCPSKLGGSVNDLNYPSVAYKMAKSDSGIFNTTFSRTVTNVGKAESIYTSSTVPQKIGNIEIRTVPEALQFTELNEKKDFKVVISGSSPKEGSFQSISFSIEWTDGTHVVRIPVVVY